MLVIAPHHCFASCEQGRQDTVDEPLVTSALTQTVQAGNFCCSFLVAEIPTDPGMKHAMKSNLNPEEPQKH